MLKVPGRLLFVLAFSGLVFALMNASKLGSTAQDVAPPGCSEPGETGDAGSSPGFEGTGDPNATVSSGVNPNEPAFEWTLERMLLATPMPMTQEERKFLSSHPPLEKIRNWTDKQFEEYISGELGLRQAAQEGYRWRELVEMLRKQQTAGASLLKKKLSKEEVVAPKEPSIFDKLDADRLQAAIARNAGQAFLKMKQWRQEIAILAGSVEAMRKAAQKKGIAEKFNDAISAAEQ